MALLFNLYLKQNCLIPLYFTSLIIHAHLSYIWNLTFSCSSERYESPSIFECEMLLPSHRFKSLFLSQCSMLSGVECLIYLVGQLPDTSSYKRYRQVISVHRLCSWTRLWYTIIWVIFTLPWCFLVVRCGLLIEVSVNISTISNLDRIAIFTLKLG